MTTREPCSCNDELLRTLERERLRLVHTRQPQRDRTRPPAQPDPQGPARLRAATREMWGTA